MKPFIISVPFIILNGKGKVNFVTVVALPLMLTIQLLIKVILYLSTSIKLKIFIVLQLHDKVYVI